MYLFKQGETWTARSLDDTHQGDGLTPLNAVCDLVNKYEHEEQLRKSAAE